MRIISGRTDGRTAGRTTREDNAFARLQPSNIFDSPNGILMILYLVIPHYICVPLNIATFLIRHIPANIYGR